MEVVDDGLGGAASLVQMFEIQGLYGYKNISMSSEYAATILIAKNGSGKTTLISAMDAFLRRQFTRLNDLDFKEITCKLRSVDELLSLKKSDLTSLLSSARKLCGDAARELGLEPTEVFDFLEGEYTTSEFKEKTHHRNNVYGAITRKLKYSASETLKYCDNLRESYYSSTPRLKKLWVSLTAALKDVEIIYLPTYRRIELPMNDDDDDYDSVPWRQKPSFQIPGRGLFSGNIQFGLSDISERLNELNQSMMMVSNSSYREISANIINDLLDGSFERQVIKTETLPDKEELLLFFSRLKDGRHRVGPYSDVSIPDIDRIYRSQADTESNKFLFYFLSKLNAAMQATRKTESLVEGFVKSCNKYLSSKDPSTQREGDVAPLDGKALCLNRRNLRVHVESLPLRRKIKLNALSSGEKQMISLFAKMFLYEKTKIVLIDEPELSLSIGWQREILKDILGAPNCAQIVAITHSPFVFDNQLEPYAKSLRLSLDKEAIARISKKESEQFMEDENNDDGF